MLTGLHSSRSLIEMPEPKGREREELKAIFLCMCVCVGEREKERQKGIFSLCCHLRKPHHYLYSVISNYAYISHFGVR